MTWYQRLSLPLMFVQLDISTINLNLSGAILSLVTYYHYYPCACHWIYVLYAPMLSFPYIIIFPYILLFTPIFINHITPWVDSLCSLTPHGHHSSQLATSFPPVAHCAPLITLTPLSVLMLNWIMSQVDSDSDSDSECIASKRCNWVYSEACMHHASMHSTSSYLMAGM